MRQCSTRPPPAMDRDYRLHSLDYNRRLEREPPRQRHSIQQAERSSGAARAATTPPSEGATFVTSPPPPPPPHRLDHTTRNYLHFSSTSGCDDCSEDSRSSRYLPEYKKQNHSKIEKKRRDKMNTYISELSAMVPSCGVVTKRLDKITVLKMTVQYLRNIAECSGDGGGGGGGGCGGRGAGAGLPAFLTESEVNAAILQAAHDSFLMVVGCDRGRLLYVSASVNNLLHCDQSELLGQSMFDLLHPKDIVVFKEQLSSSEASPRDKFQETCGGGGGGGSRFCSGARRSFFCRIKCKAPPAGREPSVLNDDPHFRDDHSHEKKYCVVHCTGYVKSWRADEMPELGSTGEEERDMSCLVAVGRALPDLLPPPPPAPSAAHPHPPGTPLQYISRHAVDGNFLFVDPRVTLAVGYLPQELVGTSLYEHATGAERGAVARAHRAALLHRREHFTPLYSFRRKDGTLALLQTHFKPFKNPWTKEAECVVANNTVVSESRGLCYASASASTNASASANTSGDDLFKEKYESVEMLQPSASASASGSTSASTSESQVEPEKIGSAIAEMLRRSSSPVLPVPTDMWHGAVADRQAPLVERGWSPGGGGGAAAAAPLDLNGDDEATMSVIMSLLEADAGLGGPVNYSGLPWPLP